MTTTHIISSRGMTFPTIFRGSDPRIPQALTYYRDSATQVTISLDPALTP